MCLNVVYQRLTLQRTANAGIDTEDFKGAKSKQAKYSSHFIHQTRLLNIEISTFRKELGADLLGSISDRSFSNGTR